MNNNFTSYLSGVMFFVICLFSQGHAQWDSYTIDNALNSATIVCVADIDGDSDLDVAATSYGSDLVVWYENSNLVWTRYPIDESLDGAVGLCIVDIDGDDTLDVVSNGHQANDVVWYENKNLSWTKHTIDGNLGGAEFIDVGDMDNDGDVDVVAVGVDGEVAWYENEDLVWEKHSIDGDLPGKPTSVAVGDMNNDDTLDVIVTESLYSKLVWYSSKNKGRLWTMSTIDSNLYGTWHLAIADLDNNDTLDVVATGQGAHDVAWYKNLGGSPVNWSKHMIDDNLLGARTVEVADIDIDGKLDVLAAGRTSNEVVWYRNNLPNLVWEKTVVDDNLDRVNHVFPGDLNEDGRVDIIAAGWDANKVIWYKNPPTDIGSMHASNPISFRLEQNYPNPFNPTTAIGYQLSAVSDVHLSIYNLVGQKVSTLVSEKQNAGYHTVEWDASGFASGVYYYRIEAGEFQDVKKMILIK
jgi:hypothetical protein